MGSPSQTYRGSAAFETAGVAYNLAVESVTTPGAEQELVNELVGAGFKALLLQAFITCRQRGKIKIENDGNIIASGRTGPGSPNFYFNWKPFNEVAETKRFKVKFTAMSGQPASDIEVYMHARKLSV